MPKQRRILVVDDNPVTLRTLTWVLEQNGYSVRTSSDPDQALATVRSEPIDLVLMDCQSTDNGCRLGPEIKRFQPGTPVIVLSGHPSAIAARSFADLLLAKPQNPQELLQHIEHCLGPASDRVA